MENFTPPETIMTEIKNGNYVNIRRALIDNAVQSVDCRFCNINDLLAVHIVQALEGTPTSSLDLGNNNIGPRGARELAKHLKKTNLKCLNLGGNHISYRGAVELAKALKGSQVTELLLPLNHIGPKGAVDCVKNLRGSHVGYLDLRLNKIFDSDTKRIARSLKGTMISRINLKWTRIGNKGLVEINKSLQNNLRYLFKIYGVILSQLTLPDLPIQHIMHYISSDKDAKRAMNEGFFYHRNLQPNIIHPEKAYLLRLEDAPRRKRTTDTRTSLLLGKAANERIPIRWWARLVHNGGERMQPTQPKSKVERVDSAGVFMARYYSLRSRSNIEGENQISPQRYYLRIR